MYKLFVQAKEYHARLLVPEGEGMSGPKMDKTSLQDVLDFLNQERTKETLPPGSQAVRFGQYLMEHHPKAKKVAGSSPPEARPAGQESDRPIWPIFLAGAAFLYLWWLAALFFDLVVVWHYYIRQSGILDRLSPVTPAPAPELSEGRRSPS